jgi:hypothetical protein
MGTRTASCSCGQLRIEVQGEPLRVGVCHCLACQRRTGSVFAALASFAAPYRVFGTATEYLRVGDQGTRFTFRFCTVCGTTVFHTEEGRNSRLWPSPSAPSLTRASPRLKIRSMTAADILGFGFRLASSRTTKTQADHESAAPHRLNHHEAA